MPTRCAEFFLAEKTVQNKSTLTSQGEHFPGQTKIHDIAALYLYMWGKEKGKKVLSHIRSTSKAISPVMFSDFWNMSVAAAFFPSASSCLPFSLLI